MFDVVGIDVDEGDRAVKPERLAAIDRCLLCGAHADILVPHDAQISGELVDLHLPRRL
jgi:hypothetical protein